MVPAPTGIYTNGHTLALHDAVPVPADVIPGGTAAIVRPGRPPLLLAAGDASLPFDVATGPATLFHMGSVGKHITAVAVLRLVEAGKVDLAAGIGRYVPGLPRSEERRVGKECVRRVDLGGRRFCKQKSKTKIKQ